MKELQFYSNDVCPFAYRVRLALAEKQIDYESIEVDLQNIPDDYYRISKAGKVPLIKHGDGIVWESTVINEYIEDAFPDIPLLPATAIERAQARLWIDYCNTSFQPNYCGLVFELDESKHDAVRKQLITALDFMEQGLAESTGPYWMGEQLTLVDLTYYPFFEHTPVLSHYRQFNLDDKYQQINNWIKIMQTRPSVKQHSRNADFYIEAYKPYVDGSMNK
ncbi:MAG: glutathione S-transferase family protein [Woeseiaceae bacterium]